MSKARKKRPTQPVITDPNSMACYSLAPTFAVSQHVTLRNAHPCSTHIVPRCSAHPRKTSGKKRGRQKPQSPPENANSISDVSVGDEFIGTIAEVGPANSSWVDIGVFTKRGYPVHARLPFPVRKGTGTRSNTRADTEGAILPVYVKSVNRYAGRIEVRKGVKPQYRNEPSAAAIMLDSVRVGDKLEGTVVGLGPYGAVLDTNVYRIGKAGKKTRCHGLLQRKSFRKEWYSATDNVIRSDADKCIAMGDIVDVYVRAAHVQNAFLLLDGYEVRAEDVAEARRQHRLTTRRRYRRAPANSLEVGEVRHGVVANVQRYGLFVDIGVKSNGLIHYSEMGERHRGDWKEAVGVNAQLSVEVIGVDDNRISLRLISLTEEALQDALEVAESPTARTEDVELAAALQSPGKVGNGSEIKTSDTVNGSNAISQATTSEVLGSDLEVDGQIDEIAENDGEVDEDEEEKDKFSDEYFEDKYGF